MNYFYTIHLIQLVRQKPKQKYEESQLGWVTSRIQVIAKLPVFYISRLQQDIGDLAIDCIF